MKREELHQLIKEEVENAIGKYAIKVHFADADAIISMIADDNKKVAAIKWNGENIATYKYDDEGVAQVSIVNTKKLADAVAALLYKFSKKPLKATPTTPEPQK